MADEVDIRKRLMAHAQPQMAQGSGGSNIEITEAELRGLRQLPDVDLVVLLSKINDRGWEESDGGTVRQCRASKAHCDEYGEHGRAFGREVFHVTVLGFF